jgi:glycogen synthase
VVHNQRVLQRRLNAFRPDVVSVWNMGAMSLSLLDTLRHRDVPVVLNLCDDWLIYGPELDPWARLFASRPRIVGRIAETLTRVPCGLPDLSDATALFISDFTKLRAAQHGRMRVGRAATTWAGIDERDFPVDTDHPRHTWAWQLLGVGRVDARKGIDVAIRALAVLPAAATLTWIGAGDEDERARLNALADDLGVRSRIRWETRRREELPALYRDADAFVFPSTWSEPLGLVPIEAMACGLPVVGSGTGGSGEFLIDEQTALVPTPVGEPSAFADAITRLANDRALRERVVAGGARVAAELTIGHLADTLDAWHQAAAARFAHGVPAQRQLQIA